MDNNLKNISGTLTEFRYDFEGRKFTSMNLLAIKNIIKDIRNEYRRELKQKNIKIKISPLSKKTDIDEEFFFYERDLRTIFKTLVDNSIKYAFPDNFSKDTKTIRFSMITDKKSFRIKIEDNGVGLDNGKKGEHGWGEGINLTRKICKFNNADLLIHSNENGTTMEIKIFKDIKEN
jgi:two-component sensor histidine kinase